MTAANTIRRMILLDVQERLRACLQLRHITDAERAVNQLMLDETKTMLNELGSERG